uniref:Uncharacterized protein n=1 Tax=Arundo donax TaxID=35708 RepID=A0A0A9C284_ARUDO
MICVGNIETVSQICRNRRACREPWIGLYSRFCQQEILQNSSFQLKNMLLIYIAHTYKGNNQNGTFNIYIYSTT